MSTAPETAAASSHATARTDPSRQRGGVALPDTPRWGEVSPASGAGEGRACGGRSPAPVLITEHEVILCTASATTGALPATSTGGRIAALLRLFTPSPDRRPARRHYPPRRYSYVEAACMAREMDRLWTSSSWSVRSPA